MPTLPSGINFGNQLTPSNSAHDGIIHSMNIKGGFQEVISITERNLIPTLANDSNGVYNAFTLSGDGGYTSGRRKIGMLVYVLETNKFYSLIPIGFFNNLGQLGQAEWLALPEWERALRIDPIGSYTSQTGNPGNGFTTIIKTASDIGITADANLCWVEANFSSGSGNINDTITENFFTAATDGATGIILGQSAIETDNTKVFVNGHLIRESSYLWKKDGNIVTADSLENGTELVWNAEDAGFPLDSTDKIQIVYETRISGSNNSEISSTITGHLIPDADEAHDLGSPTNKFRDIYMSGNTLYMGGQPLSIVNGALTLNGVAVTGNTDTYVTTESNASGIDRTLAFTVPGSTTGGMISPNQDRVFVENGTVHKVYRLQGNTWSQEGSDIPFISINQTAYYGNGQRRWSHDGNHISFWDYDDNILRVYSWNGLDWQQRGSDITGTDFRAHDINQDGTRIVLRDGINVNSIIHTYNWDGNAWIQQLAINWGYSTSTNLDVTGNKLVLLNRDSNIITPHNWNGSMWVPDNTVMGGYSLIGEWTGDGNRIWATQNNPTGLAYVTWPNHSNPLIYTYPEIARQSYHLNYTGSTALVSDFINNKWYIAKDNGFGALIDVTVGNPTPTNSTSANADVTKVIDNEGTNTEDFYLYNIGNSLNANAYLNTSTLEVGDITSIYFSVSLAYTSVQTAHIYQDINNWIRVRVIQNTTSQDNLLQVEVLEKQGNIVPPTYSITLG